jgi:hypothetical protein
MIPPDGDLLMHRSTIGRSVYSFWAMLEMLSHRAYPRSIFARLTLAYGSVLDTARFSKNLMSFPASNTIL